MTATCLRVRDRICAKRTDFSPCTRTIPDRVLRLPAVRWCGWGRRYGRGGQWPRAARRSRLEQTAQAGERRALETSGGQARQPDRRSQGTSGRPHTLPGRPLGPVLGIGGHTPSPVSPLPSPSSEAARSAVTAQRRREHPAGSATMGVQRGKETPAGSWPGLPRRPDQRWSTSSTRCQTSTFRSRRRSP